ncbi:MAG TPA: response regulator [Bryobacteraceae bacterium]|nr:response regulator [Bryobacteraceae bacterium]
MNITSELRGTVLIVDDDPAVLVLIQAILSAAGYRALSATTRADAVRLTAQKHIHLDLALLDVYMPGVSGTALADEILSIRPDIRVLWMSGFVKDEFIRVKLVDGYAGFLPKPLRRDGLLRAVEQAINGVPEQRPAQAARAGGGSA